MMILTDKIIKQIQPHSEHLTTVRKWDEYAKLHNLPSSSTLIYNFGSWDQLKGLLGISSSIIHYTKDDLLEIAKVNNEYFTSKRLWNDYALKNNLPSSTIYINTFGNWNAVKDLLNMKRITSKGSYKYSKDEIKNILKKHGKYLENRTQWDQYAKKNKLPTYKTMRNHFSWDDILQLAGKKKKRNFNKDDLLSIASKHKSTFFPASIKQWDHYAREKSLPTSSVFIRVFKTWRKAKIFVAKHNK